MIALAAIVALLDFGEPLPTSITASAKGISLTVRQAPERDPELGILKWGYWPDSPNLAVRRVDLRVDGASWFTPLSAYVDLANVRKATVRRQSGAVVVLMQGADAGSSWGARFVYRREDLARREVWSGEFPEYHRQKTEYTNLSPPD